MEENNTVIETEIPGVFIIDRPTFEDERGFFRETFRKNELEEKLGKLFNPVQENHSRSQKGVLRGIHVAPWGKLIYVPHGKVQEVIVDLRKGSPTFGKSISLILGEEKRNKVYIPPFCGNAYLVLSDEADYMYLTDDYWQAGKEYGILWNDLDLAIDWQRDDPIVSDKDKVNKSLKEIFPV